MTAITRTCAARRATITNGLIAPTIQIQNITRTATTASVGTNKAETDLGTMADSSRGTVTIIMMMEIEIAKDSVMIVAIGISGAGAEILAKAVVERCQAQKHGALSVLTKLGTPSVGVLDAQ